MTEAVSDEVKERAERARAWAASPEGRLTLLKGSEQQWQRAVNEDRRHEAELNKLPTMHRPISNMTRINYNRQHLADVQKQIAELEAEIAGNKEAGPE